jgi:integrase
MPDQGDKLWLTAHVDRRKKKALTPATWRRDHDQIHKWVVPYLGNRPIASIKAPELLDVLKRIEAKGVIDTAHRTREVCGRVPLRDSDRRAKRDIAADLRGDHRPARVGRLLRAIDGYDGQPTTTAVLKLAFYVFVRSTELRAAEWSEFVLGSEQPVRSHR